MQGTWDRLAQCDIRERFWAQNSISTGASTDRRGDDTSSSSGEDTADGPEVFEFDSKAVLRQVSWATKRLYSRRLV